MFYLTVYLRMEKNTLIFSSFFSNLKAKSPKLEIVKKAHNMIESDPENS